MNISKALIIQTLVAALLCACSKADEATWKEEVKLHDGRIIQVERRATRGENDFPNPGRGSLGENELVYEPLNAHWHSRKRAADWVLSFDVFDGTAYLVIDGAGAQYCKAHGPNIYNAQFLKWAGDHWLNVGQNGVPLAQLTQNMSLNYWGSTSAGDASGLMTWHQKLERAAGEHFPQPLVERLGDRTCGHDLPYFFQK